MPVFNAVKPSSFDASVKKYFFSISCAIIGSKIIDVFPVPEPPHTSNDWNLRSSEKFIFLPESKSLNKNTSHA